MNKELIKEKILETENDPYLHDYVIQKKIRKILTENIDWKVFTIEELVEQIFGLFKKDQEDLLKKIEGRIEENNKWKNEKGICGVCMEDDYCFHDIENQALEDIKKLIEI